MSSSNFQVVKKSRKFHMTPQLGEEQVVSSSKVRTFTSSRTGGADQLAISSQGASVSGKRGLNLVPQMLLELGFKSLDETTLLEIQGPNYLVLLKDLDLVLLLEKEMLE
jgi:uncharacterized membrane-anchored protein